eukprot:m.31562 g.31562  ORF g.31562 m.31562 type:complete len:129 (+) comp6318_c0_seq1:109-495(+)
MVKVGPFAMIAVSTNTNSTDNLLMRVEKEEMLDLLPMKATEEGARDEDEVGDVGVDMMTIWNDMTTDVLKEAGEEVGKIFMMIIMMMAGEDDEIITNDEEIDEEGRGRRSQDEEGVEDHQIPVPVWPL